MAPFFDVDLEKIAQVVERRAGHPEMPLLLDRRRLGVALRDDQPAQDSAMLARHFAPDRIALMLPERNLAVGFRVGEKNPPSIVRHLDVSESRPALRVGRRRRPQIHVAALKSLRAHLVPPLQKDRLPRLERALQAAVVGEIYGVWNPLGIVARHPTLLGSNSGRAPR